MFSEWPYSLIIFITFYWCLLTHDDTLWDSVTHHETKPLKNRGFVRVLFGNPSERSTLYFWKMHSFGRNPEGSPKQVRSLDMVIGLIAFELLVLKRGCWDKVFERGCRAFRSSSVVAEFRVFERSREAPCLGL